MTFSCPVLWKSSLRTKVRISVTPALLDLALRSNCCNQVAILAIGAWTAITLLCCFTAMKVLGILRVNQEVTEDRAAGDPFGFTWWWTPEVDVRVMRNPARA